MLSLSQVRTQLFPLFQIMKTTGMVVEVTYRGAVYEMHVRRTKKTPVYTRSKRATKQILPHRIDVETCPKCEYLMFSGVCMNTKCIAQDTEVV